jgi:hypothetical protein
MPGWLGPLVAIAALLVIAPLVGWLFSRHGRRIKGGLALASIMLGFGVPLDPPTKHLIEAKEGQVKGDNENGEPPRPPKAPKAPV